MVKLNSGFDSDQHVLCIIV